MVRVASAIAIAALAYAVVPASSNAAPIAPLSATVTTEADGMVPVYYWGGHYYPYRWHGHYYPYRWHGHYYHHRHWYGRYWRYW